MVKHANHNTLGYGYALAFVLIAVACLVTTGLRLAQGYTQFSSDILAVVPNRAEINSPILQNAKNTLQQRSSDQLVFSSDNKSAIVALTNALKTNPLLSHVAPPDIALSDVVNFYTNYPGSLMASNYPSHLSQPNELLNYTLAELTKPDSTLSASSLEKDPTLALASFLNDVAKTGALQQEDGIHKTTLNPASFLQSLETDKQSSFYFVRFMQNLNAANFSQSIQLTQSIKSEIEKIETEYNSPIYYSGFAFHGSENAEQAEHEISTFGLFSLVSVALLVVLFFRNLTVIGLMFATIFNACLWGITALVITFDSVELIGLVFSITLIGVAIDYLFHVLCADKVSITSSLILGFMTTAAGYALYSFAPMVLLQQVAVFMIFGLLGALIFALYCQKYLVLNVTIPRIIWQDCLVFINRFKLQILASAVFVLSVGFVVKPIIHQDDVALLSSTSDELQRNEALNLTLFGQSNKHHFLIVGSSIQDALEKQEAVIAWLKDTDETIQVNSLANYLPSLAQQQATYKTLTNKVTAGHYKGVSDTLGINVGLREYSPLTVSAFERSVLSPLLQVHQITQTDDANVLWFSTDLLSEQTLAQLLSSHSRFLNLIDKRQEISDALGHYRMTVMGLMVLSVLVAMIVMALRFDLVTALFTGVIICTVTVCALLLSSWLQTSVNLFNYLATILILALAIDYLIFYRSKGLCQSNLQAISLSLCSSCLVFGILIFSKTPAVFSFGLTLVIGLIGLYVLAPCIVKERK